MTIKLSTIGSTNVTVDVRPSPFPEAARGICISYGLYDGPLTFTLSVEEARALVADIIHDLTAPRSDWWIVFAR